MTGPAWLAAGLAGLMIAIAACCAGRLAVARLQARATEVDADGLHVLMGVAMAGMLEPRLSPLPAVVWLGVFAAGAAWFAGQAIRARGRARPWLTRCAYPGPHVVECLAMIYMLGPAAGSSGHGTAMGMAAMGGPAGVAGGNPALPLVLALLLLGCVLWTADRRIAAWPRASEARPDAGAAATPGAGSAPVPGAGSAPVSVAGSAPVPVAGSAPVPVADPTPGVGTAPAPALAPGLAACSKIVMGVTMGYMLLMMV